MTGNLIIHGPYLQKKSTLNVVFVFDTLSFLIDLLFRLKRFFYTKDI